MLGCFRPSFLPRRSLDWECYELGLVREHGPCFLILLFIVELWSTAALLPTDDQMNACYKVRGSQEWIHISPSTPLQRLMALAGFSPISLPVSIFQQDLPLPHSVIPPVLLGSLPLSHLLPLPSLLSLLSLIPFSGSSSIFLFKFWILTCYSLNWK